jgi:hypothetical protein
MTGTRWTRRPPVNEGEPDLEYTWTARELKPRVVLYVLLVFLAFMALAEFGFHSTAAVKALFLAAIPSVAGMIPGLLSRTEYNVTGSGMWKRSLKRAGKGDPSPSKEVFSWDQVDRIVPTSEGFKYYTRIEDKGLFRRVLKLHVLAGHSGEVHVETEDRDRVWATLASHGFPATRKRTGGRLRARTGERLRSGQESR